MFVLDGWMGYVAARILWILRYYLVVFVVGVSFLNCDLAMLFWVGVVLFLLRFDGLDSWL